MSATMNAGPIDAGRLAALLDHEGMTFVRAARMLGVTVARVFRAVRSLPPECRPTSERRGRPAADADVDVDADRALELRDSGLSYARVARELGCSPAEARRAVASARRGGDAPPPDWRFRPLDPAAARPFKPGMACTHGPIERGSLAYCLGCDASGWDAHPRFKAVRRPPPSAPEKPSPRRAWSAEAKADADKLAAASAGLTRRERRALEFAAAEAERARELFGRLSGSTDPDLLEREGDDLGRTYGPDGSWGGAKGGRGNDWLFGSRVVASQAGAH